MGETKADTKLCQLTGQESFLQEVVPGLSLKVKCELNRHGAGGRKVVMS